jgi:protein-S-isoprenylcysteine O-methyltransferase Ste14
VKSTIDGLDNSYAYFAVAEDEKDGLHRTAVNRGSLKLQSSAASRAAHGRIATPILFGFLVIFIAAALFSRLSTMKNARIAVSLHKYASRMILITTAYLLLKNGGAVVAFFLEYIDAVSLRQFGSILINHFNGSNYLYFFTYVIDLYFVACLLLLYPYLYYRESDIPLHEDKYSSLLLTVASVGSVLRGGSFYWNYTSRLGLLTCCVKLFFLPLLVSWVINNTFHQINISKTLVFDLVALNAWLLSFFIYVDTILFCFGYIFEFKFLKNEIRSVEPTFFGWLVCLWCYPPFNSVSYQIFDHRLIDISHAWPANVVMAMSLLITALWGIFAWASVALGAKASNLTNRGIVSSGPYRYVRHPAYASKLLVFYIQGIFLGQYFLGLLFGFTIIYMLRAWTEERHLSLDPDYIEYKKLVKWRLIPGVI